VFVYAVVAVGQHLVDAVGADEVLAALRCADVCDVFVQVPPALVALFQLRFVDICRELLFGGVPRRGVGRNPGGDKTGTSALKWN